MWPLFDVLVFQFMCEFTLGEREDGGNLCETYVNLCETTFSFGHSIIHIE